MHDGVVRARRALPKIGKVEPLMGELTRRVIAHVMCAKLPEVGWACA